MALKPNIRRATCDCADISPERFWALRDDLEFQRYVAIKSDPPTVPRLVSSTEVDGVTTRVTDIVAMKNPIPYLLRSTLGCKEGFTIRLTESWRRDAYGTEHKCTFISEPPVLPDRISITGCQWVEAHGTGCRMFFELDVRCTVKGAGATIAKLLSEKTMHAFTETPLRLSEYLAMSRQAADATERASQHSDDGEADTADVRLRLRARLRWRMALAYVRFERVLELQKSDEYRLCDVRVGEPRNEGFGPKKHTTYLISTCVRGAANAYTGNVTGTGLSGGGGVGVGIGGVGGWIECRKRFSDFVALRDALVEFLPGYELPTLPERGVSNRLGATVVEGRRVGLHDFLQAVLDHPILCTADALAAFLGWPDGAAGETMRAPLFARAQSAYDTPACPQRKAHERMWSLRRQASLGPSEPRRSSIDGTGRSDSLGGSGSGVGSSVWHERASLASAGTRESISEDQSTTTPYRARSEYGRSTAEYSDVLGAAVLRAAEDAASVVQRRQRSRPSSLRASRLSETEESPPSPVLSRAWSSPSPAPSSRGFPSSSSGGGARRPTATTAGLRDELAGVAHEADMGETPMSASSAGSADEGRVAARLLRKLEDIEVRLRQIERNQQQSWVWERLFGCGGIQR